MKVFILNTARKLAYFTSLVLDHLPIQKKYGGVVLCYHNIAKDKWTFSLSLQRLEQQINFMTQNFQACTAMDLEEYLNKKKIFSKPFFLITFDDGYKSVYETKDMFLRNNIKPLVFLLSDSLNANRKEMENNLELLDIAEINKLKILGWEFGCHSATHKDFWNLSSAEMQQEIIDSKKSLERQLGFEIKYFAYPKGRYTSKITKIVKQAGYKMAFSMDAEELNTETDVHLIPRIGIMNTHTFMEFRASMLPWGIKVRGMFSKKGNLSHEN